MKVLFVLNATHQWERLGILSLSSVLKRCGNEVRLFDVHRKRATAIVESVLEENPDVLAYSAMSNEIGPLMTVNRLLRQSLPPTVKSVFGGPHPTFCPELIRSDFVDAVCRGDAEASFPLYLEYLESARRVDEIPGFRVRQGSAVVENPIAADGVVNLDLLPMPDRRLWDVIDPRPVQKSFFAARGCPYKCAFCFNEAYRKLYPDPHPVVRRRSVSHLILEIREVIRLYPEIHPFFDDDSFLTAPLAWLEEFAHCYRAEIQKPFGCNIRADQVSEKKVKLLADAGWNYCWFGIECGDETFANEVMRRGMTNNQIVATARLLRSHGIWFATQNINALPSDRALEMDEMTLRLNLECKPDFAMAHVFFPFPGTRLAEYSREKGFFDGDYSILNDPMCLTSPLAFCSEMKKALERQNRLFGPIVELPWLRPLLPSLRKLPLGRLYALAHFLCLGYCTRLKLAPVRNGMRGYRALVALLFRRVAQARRGRRKSSEQGVA
jgi:anaerobic magnesium-protoporphyrin IX monomethyl ester cyclase